MTKRKVLNSNLDDILARFKFKMAKGIAEVVGKSALGVVGVGSATALCVTAPILLLPLGVTLGYFGSSEKRRDKVANYGKKYFEWVKNSAYDVKDAKSKINAYKDTI